MEINIIIKSNGEESVEINTKQTDTVEKKELKTDFDKVEVEDLNTLYENRAFSFSMNRCYQMFNKTKWRPNCYLVADAKACTTEARRAMGEMMDGGTSVFYSRLEINNMPSRALYFKADFVDFVYAAVVTFKCYCHDKTPYCLRGSMVFAASSKRPFTEVFFFSASLASMPFLMASSIFPRCTVL